jgi:hypothetical protein
VFEVNAGAPLCRDFDREEGALTSMRQGRGKREGRA